MEKLRLAFISLVVALTVGFGYTAATQTAHAAWYDGGATGGGSILMPWAELMICGWVGC